MEEQLDNTNCFIKLDSLYEILTDFYFLAKIRYNKNSNKTNESNSKDRNTHEKKIFDYFKNNLDDNNLELYKKHKNIFQIENDSNCYFNSEHYYYSSNESISLIDINKKQNEFFLTFEKFYKSFQSKIFDLIKDETLYHNIFKIAPKNSNINENKINQNILKIINNNISNNKQNSNNKNALKYFLFDENENKDLDNSSKEIENYNFFEFIKNQKMKKSCFDFITNNEYFKDNLKNIFFVIKNKEQFKNFFFEFFQNENLISNKDFNNNNNSLSINYNSYINKTSENLDNVNLDFLRVSNFI